MFNLFEQMLNQNRILKFLKQFYIFLRGILLTQVSQKLELPAAEELHNRAVMQSLTHHTQMKMITVLGHFKL